MPVCLPTFGKLNIVEVSAGYDHVAALTGERTSWCDNGHLILLSQMMEKCILGDTAVMADWAMERRSMGLFPSQ